MSTILTKHGVVSFEQNFKTISEIDVQIENYKEYINDSKTKLQMLASANPKDITPKEYEDDPLFYIKHETDELISSIEEYAKYIEELESAKYLLEQWEFDNHDGIPALNLNNKDDLRIVLPENRESRSAQFNKENPFEPKPYKSVDNYIKDVIADIKNEGGPIFGKYYAVFKDDGTILTKDTGEFLFRSKDAIIEYLTNSINPMQFITNKFSVNNPEFFDDIRKNVSDVKKFNDLLNDINNGEFKKWTSVYDELKRIFIEVLLSKIEIKEL